MHAEACKIIGFISLFDFYSIDYFGIQMPCEETQNICEIFET